MRDVHNDTARFGEASAQDVFTLNPPTPQINSKRGSIFLKLEERNFNPGGGPFPFLQHQPKTGEFSVEEYSVGPRKTETSGANGPSLENIPQGPEHLTSAQESSEESFLEPEPSAS